MCHSPNFEPLGFSLYKPLPSCSFQIARGSWNLWIPQLGSEELVFFFFFNFVDSSRLFKKLEHNRFRLCVSFCCTMKWISCMYAYILSLWGLPPTSHPHPIPLGHHRALSWALCDAQQRPSLWLSILHMVVYIGQCYSFNSSHPLCPPMPSSPFSMSA